MMSGADITLPQRGQAGGRGGGVRQIESPPAAEETQGRGVVPSLQGLAEDAGLVRPRLADVLVAPGGPKVVHGSTSLTTGFLIGAARLGRRAGVEQLLQFLAGLEEGDALRGDLDLGAGLGVASQAPAALAGAEAAEAADFDLVVALQGLDDAVEDGLDHRLRVFAGGGDSAGDFLDQLGLGHGFLLTSPQDGLTGPAKRWRAL